MPTKLTLSMNQITIAKAKRWAKLHDTSLSGLVERYFNSLTSDKGTFKPLSSKTKSLSGLFKDYDEDLSYKELIAKTKGKK